MNRRSGWLSLLVWALGFVLLALAALGAMTIGRFILPFAAVVLVVAALRHRAWPEGLCGALTGVAAVLLFVAIGNRDFSPCLPEHQTMVLRRGQSFSCGGLDPMPWLLLGVPMLVTGVAGYALWRKRRWPETRAP